MFYKLVRERKWSQKEKGKRVESKGYICSVFGLHKLGLKRKAIKEEIMGKMFRV